MSVTTDKLSTYQICQILHREHYSYDDFLKLINTDELLEQLSDENKYLYYEFLVKLSEKFNRLKPSDSNRFDVNYIGYNLIKCIYLCYNLDIDICHDKYRKLINLFCNIFDIDINHNEKKTPLINLIDYYYNYGMINYNIVPYIEILLDYGADPSITDRDGYDAYFFSTYNDDNSDFNLFDHITNYLDLNIKDPGEE
jgi:hypothetical protein